MDFFVNEELKEFQIEDKVFKYKPITANDELDWATEYMELVEEKNESGKNVVYKKQNDSKLMRCQMRNIVQVPWSMEELQKVTGLAKPYSEYNAKEKDLLFGKLDAKIYVRITKEIDKLKGDKKKP